MERTNQVSHSVAPQEESAVTAEQVWKMLNSLHKVYKTNPDDVYKLIIKFLNLNKFYKFAYAYDGLENYGYSQQLGRKATLPLKTALKPFEKHITACRCPLYKQDRTAILYDAFTAGIYTGPDRFCDKLKTLDVLFKEITRIYPEDFSMAADVTTLCNTLSLFCGYVTWTSRCARCQSPYLLPREDRY